MNKENEGSNSIRQGDVYWYHFGPVVDSSPAGLRPCVVIQSDRFNEKRIQTTVVCVITSNMRLARVPGNVVLPKGSAGLIRDSVVNVTQVYTVDKHDLADRLGRLTAAAVDEIRAGIHLLVE